MKPSFAFAGRPKPMQSLTFYRSALTLSAIATLLAGCGGSQPPVPNVNKPQLLSMPEKQRLFVVSLTYGYDGSVGVYSPTARGWRQVASIINGIDDPSGVCIDSTGTLYVTNDPINGTGWVSEYRYGKTTPALTITNGISTPAFCAVDGQDDVWVTNLGSRNATEYPKGSDEPSEVISQGLVYPDGIAIDPYGNLYIANRLADYSGNIDVYASGGTVPSRTITDGVKAPVGLAIGKDNVLYVADDHDNEIKEYPYRRGHPSRILRKGLYAPTGLAIGRNDDLFVSNFEQNSVVEFSTSSNTPKSEITGIYAPIGLTYFSGN